MIEPEPTRATACNCTVCRRYGALWAYGRLGQSVRISGTGNGYVRADSSDLEFVHCSNCGCLTHYVATAPSDDGKTLAAVNLRMVDPEDVAEIPLRHFDGFETWQAVEGHAAVVKDLWF
ncbi:MAG: GFA family protein [Pseudomonadota bacterium]